MGRKVGGSQVCGGGIVGTVVVELVVAMGMMIVDEVVVGSATVAQAASASNIMAGSTDRRRNTKRAYPGLAFGRGLSSSCSVSPAPAVVR